jgi:SEC-C motif domain protein
MINTDPCPCGLPADYGNCCGRWHAGALVLQAPSAEVLMRSRYSAYVLDLREYLLQTWHASTRPDEIAAPEPGLRWLGLTVKRHELLSEHRAVVEFVARSKLAGRAYRLHETSRFVREDMREDVREDGRWFYVDGEIS